MNKNKLIKTCALFLGAALAAGTFAALPSFKTNAVPATEQVTYFDFEDGKNPFSNSKGEAITNDYVVEDADGNKILKPTNGGGLKGAYPFSTDYFTLGSGIKDGWKETARPTRVQFRLKLAGQTQSDIFYFHPLWSADAKQYNTFKFSIKNFQNKIDINATTYWSQRLFYASEDGKATARTGGYPTGNSAASLAEGSWYDCECVYDWSKFNAENGWQVSFEFTVTDGRNTRVYSETLKERKPSNDKFTGTLPEYTNTTGFSIGFEGNPSDTAATKSAIDDLTVWSYDTENTSAEYIPTPKIKALGAVVASTGDNNGLTNVKAAFDFRIAKKITEANGEEISGFGAVISTDAKTPEQMSELLNKAISGQTLTSDCAYVHNDVSAIIPLPDVYTVTVENSGEKENMGKKMTAMAFITVGDKVYVSDNNGSTFGVTAGTVSCSSMGLLKEVFRTKFFKADYADALNSAISDYNSNNSTSYTTADINEIANKTGQSSKKDKEVMAALYTSILAISGDEEPNIP